MFNCARETGANINTLSSFNWDYTSRIINCEIMIRFGIIPKLFEMIPNGDRNDDSFVSSHLKAENEKQLIRQTRLSENRCSVSTPLRHGELDSLDAEERKKQTSKHQIMENLKSSPPYAILRSNEVN